VAPFLKSAVWFLQCDACRSEFRASRVTHKSLMWLLQMSLSPGSTWPLVICDIRAMCILRFSFLYITRQPELERISKTVTRCHRAIYWLIARIDKPVSKMTNILKELR